MKRIFSRQTYNGYHLVGYTGEPPLALAKKGEGKDECGTNVGDVLDMADVCRVDSMARRLRPWEPWLFVPSVCQRCEWVYRNPQGEYDCLLCTKAKGINPGALVNGKP